MNVKVHELVTASVVTTKPDESLDEVRRLLEEYEIGAIPVVDQSGQPVGIVSATDLVRDVDSSSPVDATHFYMPEP